MPKPAALLAAATAILMILPTSPNAQQPALKMTLFGQPSVNNDSIWLAFD